MNLADFIIHDIKGIVKEWVDSAPAHISSAAGMPRKTVRGHVKQILLAVAKGMATHQSKPTQQAIAKGIAPKPEEDSDTAAMTHAVLRAESGFDIDELAAEYCLMRNCVIRRWMDACEAAPHDFADLARFNQVIDQALCDSIGSFTHRVEQARKMVLAMVSHDMRNPLVAITMSAAYLKAIKAGSKVSRVAARLACASYQMSTLLDDMVDFKRSMLGLGINVSKADINLATVLTKEVKLLRVAHPGRQIGLDVLGDTFGCWDAVRMRQVLRNLISNAIKYGSPDTPISTVITGHANDVRVEVTNSGQICDKSDLQQLFDPLVRGSSNGDKDDTDRNSGLGLFIVREIAHAHGGEVEVRSGDGVTVFGVVLPRIKKCLPSHLPSQEIDSQPVHSP